MRRLLKLSGFVALITTINLVTILVLVGPKITGAGPGCPVGPGPEATCNGDVNGDGSLDITDAIYLLGYLFGQGEAPVAIAGPAPGLPPPSYDSGWVLVPQATMVELTHNVGGDSDKYLVQMKMKGDRSSGTGNIGVNNFRIGGHQGLDPPHGCWYSCLTPNTIHITREVGTDHAELGIRIQIWKVE